MKKRRITISVLLLIYFITMISPVITVKANDISEDVNYSDKISQAMEWISSNQNEDGSWGSSVTELNTYTVLKLLENELSKGENFNKGIEWAKEKGEKNHDFKARRFAINLLSNKDEINKIVSKQNDDGGFGTDYGYSSDNLDTNLVLKMLINQKDDYSNSVEKSMAYLINNQNQDGSFSLLKGTDGDISLTSEVIINLTEFINKTNQTSNGIESTIEKASKFIDTKIAQESLIENDKESARKFIMSYKALQKTKKPKELLDIEEKVMKLQGADGSVLEDPFLTTLFIEALKERNNIPQVLITDINMYKETTETPQLSTSFKAYDNVKFELVGSYDEKRVEIFVLIKKVDGSYVNISSTKEQNNNCYSWDVSNESPGNYTMNILARDKETGNIVDEIKKDFNVESSFEVSNIAIYINPKEIRVGEDKEISINSILLLKSNIKNIVTVKTTVKDGEGNIIFSTEKEGNCNETDSSVNVQSLMNKVNTEKTCTYTINVSAYSGDKLLCGENKEFKVLPEQAPTRVDVSQELSKSILYPGSDGVEGIIKLKGEGTPEGQIKPIDLMLVLDCSGSMSGSRITQSRVASNNIVNMLKGENRCGITFFSNSGRIQQGLTKDISSLHAAINQSYANGGTSIDSGINVALNHLKTNSGADKEKAIILLSDGGSNYQSAISAANTAASSGVKIYSIGLGSGVNSNLLSQIANITGGQYIASPTAEQLNGIMTNIAGEIFNKAGSDLTLQTTIPQENIKADIANINPKPSEIKYNVDGSLTLKWNKDKVIMGDETSFKIPYIGEGLKSESNIALTKDTVLTYKDKNGNTVKQDIDSLKINVNKYLLNTDVNLDKEQYTANEKIKINVETENLTQYPCSLKGRVEITDDNGTVVETLPDEVNGTWAAKEKKNIQVQWDTKKYLVGKYTAKVTWYENNKNISTGSKEFEIVQDGNLNNSVTTNKTSYNANEDVNITEKINNTSTNKIEIGTKVETKIVDSYGNEVYKEAKELEDILFNTQITKALNCNTGSNSPGEYSVVSTLYKGNEKVTESTVKFNISSTVESFVGISGSIKLSNNKVKPNDSITITSNISNTGNTNIENLKSKVRIIDLKNNNEIKCYDENSNLLVNDEVSKTYEFKCEKLVKGDYLVLYESIDKEGMVTSLDSSSFAVEYISDDFEKESDLWNYMGSAHRSSEGYAVLTTNQDNQAGAMWLKKGIKGPFVSKFKYKAGGGTGADGFTFIFNKKANELGGNGREMGFNPGNGYGLEFDSFYNKFHGESTTVQSKHIAFCKDVISSSNPGEIITPLALNVEKEFAEKLSDNNWHDVEVRVRLDGIEVFVDGRRAISWKGEIDDTYDGFGFSAGTGTTNDNHFIDDVEIQENTEIKLSNITDNFSSDTNKWKFMGDAHRDLLGYAVLTTNNTWKSGAMWLDDVVSLPFTTKFKYKAGGGTGADGFTFMFAKNRYELGDNGNMMGFKPGNGYGLEFDSFFNSYNGENTGVNKAHLALGKDKLATNTQGEKVQALAVNSNDNIASKLSDNNWHDVEVRAKNDGVEVFIDGESSLVWNGTLDKTYSGVGFSAGTGGYTNNHFIDDVEINEDIKPTLETIKDDFSLDTGLWNYMGCTSRLNEGVARLTPNENWKAGAMWLKTQTSNSFTTKFKYKSGESSVGKNSDGFTYMFYKKQDEIGNSGESQGFAANSGYGIEFDSFYNGSANEGIEQNSAHISLIKNSTIQNNWGAGPKMLAYNVNSDIVNKLTDNNYHDVEVRVSDNTVQVYIDTIKAIDYKGTLDTTYRGIGFSGATGGYNQKNFIDDFEIAIKR